MTEYIEIAEKLTTEEKITLIADIGKFSEEFAVNVGAPKFTVRRADEVAESLGMPSFCEFINSWDLDVAKTYFGYLAKKAKDGGADALVLPDFKPRSTAYVAALSEDPYLNTEYAKAAAEATESVGVVPIFACSALNDGELRYSDKLPDKTAINEYYYKTVKTLAERGNATFLYGGTYKNQEYLKANIEKNLFSDIAPAKRVFVLSDKTGETCYAADCEFINFGGDGAGISEAYNNYEKTIKDVESGAASVNQLNDAVNEGLAVSIEKINEALYRAISCVEQIKSRAKSKERQMNLPSDEKLFSFLEKAAASSLVTLKNDACFPLKKKNTVAVIGETESGNASEFAEFAKNYGFSVVGFSKGYDIEKEGNDEYEKEAVTLGERADVALVFIGQGKERGRAAEKTEISRLPANQIALLYALSQKVKRVIAILCGNYPADASVLDKCSAVLVACDRAEISFRAICETLSGKSSAYGRLSYTLYCDCDEYFYKIRADKETDKNKIGPFIGYRNYDANEVVLKFPFGYGKESSCFEYSKLKIRGNVAEFMVKNLSKRTAEETVQIYIGKKETALLRPNKQLKAFKKIRLGAKGSAKISITLPQDAFSFYDEAGGKITEGGEYDVYVCSDVQEVKLVGSINMTGRSVSKNKRDKIEFLQSESNIVSGGYRLSAQNNSNKSHKKAMKAGLITVIVSSILTGLTVLTEIFNRLDIINFDLFMNNVIGLYMQIIVGAVLIVSLIIGISLKKIGKKKLEAEQSETVSSKAFDEGYVSPKDGATSIYDKLFAEEFSETSESQEEEEETAEDIDPDHSSYYERGFTLEELKNRLSAFINGRGITVGNDVVIKTVAALCASRYIIWKCDDEALLGKYLGLLAEFFGCDKYVDVIDETYKTAEDLFYNETTGTTHNITAAIRDASANGHKAVFAVLANVKPSEANAYFTDLIQYTVNPVKNYEIPLSSGGIADGYLVVTPNFWTFAVTTKDGDNGELPSFIADAAVTVVLNGSMNDNADETKYPAPSYYQTAYLAEKARNAYALPEELWKRVDRLDVAIEDKVGLKIKNKTWGILERLTSMYLAVGGDPKDALDFAVAGKILPSTFRAYAVKGERVELINTVENILGDDGVAECKRLLKVETAEYEKAENAANAENVETVETVENTAAEQPTESGEESIKEQPTIAGGLDNKNVADNADLSGEQPAEQSPLKTADGADSDELNGGVS